ncbi:MAG: YdeI/OmpD-associated family protein [Terriglobales bacterium]
MPKASRAKPTPAAKRFEARLERLRSGLNWVIIRVPFDAAKLWGTRGQSKVKGEINGFAFRTSLLPTREGWHFLLVNKRMQKEARAVEGSVARFQMELDREERTVTIPDEIKRILSRIPSEDRSLRRWYDELNHSTRNDIAKWITEPKSAEARVRRAEQIAERLLNVMDAERELPPILQVAFARHPRAREGWDGMSASRRRIHLFGIFYYRTPDARARRIDKMLDDATALAEKSSSKKNKR